MRISFSQKAVARAFFLAFLEEVSGRRGRQVFLRQEAAPLVWSLLRKFGAKQTSKNLIHPESGCEITVGGTQK